MVFATGLPACGVVSEEEGEDGEDVAQLGEELVTSGAGIVNTDNVNLRKTASTSGAIVDVLDRGTHVSVTGAKKSANGLVWVPVKTEANKEGWLAAKYLSPAPPLDLDKVVAFLGREVARRSPGTKLSIAVRILGTNEGAQLAGDVPRPSASSAKAVWAAAALAKNTAASLEDEMRPVFISSDNDAAGELIDLAGGIDAVNVFYTKAGMTKSGVLHWSTGGKTRVDSDEPHLLGDDNYMTANDGVTFLTRLNGTLLPSGKRAKLMSWMTLSPNSGTGGWLTARLPAAVRDKVMHKAGWLPPPLSSRALNEIGIVPTPSGKRYAVAILSSKGDDWFGKQAPFVELASCLIYRSVEKAKTLDCE
jgi:beta-lactamase class A